MLSGFCGNWRFDIGLLADGELRSIEHALKEGLASYQTLRCGPIGTLPAGSVHRRA